MTEVPRLTDERLRSWLDGNVPGRERLAQAVLALDHRFSHVQPRSPLGGPDSGRDLEASFGGSIVWVAVGFVNSANDSQAQRTKITRKFKQDLSRALGEKPDLTAFCFLTNVRLTPRQREQWQEHGNAAGLSNTILFDRENLRVTLDSPAGLAARYQYLDVPLSLAEQNAFFAHWGDELQFMISNSFESVGRRLERLEFLQQAGRPLRDIGFSIRFAAPPTRLELPHFRAVMLIHLREGTPGPIGIAELGSWGGDDNNATHPRESILWLGQEVVDRFRYVTSGAPTGIYGGIGRIGGHPRLAQLTIMDLESAFIDFYVNESAAARIASVHVRANEYVVHSAERRFLLIDTDRSNFSVSSDRKLPFEIGPEAATDPWVRVTTGMGPLDFERRTPWRRYQLDSDEGGAC